MVNIYELPLYTMKQDLLIRNLGLQPYKQIWQAMCKFSRERTLASFDEVWFCEHPPVFTLGRHGKTEHILNPHHIPVIRTDRGGQVTYHGPGQLLMYCLIDLKRRRMGIKELVCQLEAAVIKTLAEYQIVAERQPKAPGIYINGAKIASLGLRVAKGATYHGLSFNIDMDLSPFTYINPCGYQNLTICQLADFVKAPALPILQKQLAKNFTLPYLPGTICQAAN